MFVAFTEFIVIFLLLFFGNPDLPEGFVSEEEPFHKYTKKQMVTTFLFSVAGAFATYTLAKHASHMEQVQKEYTNMEILFTFHNTL